MGQGYRILLVEDERPHVELVQRAFREYPHDVVVACSSVAATLEQLDRESFDALVVDYSLHQTADRESRIEDRKNDTATRRHGDTATEAVVSFAASPRPPVPASPEQGATGLSLLEEVQRRGLHLPVIMVTGRGDEATAVQAMKLGAADYIVKSGNYAQALPRIVHNAIEKRLLERKLHEADEFFRQTIMQSPIAIMIADASGTWLMANNKAMELFGIADLSEVLGKLNLFDHPTLLKHGVMPQVRRVLDGEVVQLTLDMNLSEVRYTTTKVGTLTLRGTFFPLLKETTDHGPRTTDHGPSSIVHRPSSIVVMIEDITNQKKLEQQLLEAQKMEGIGKLASGIAHDFNNLLGAILGYASLIRAELQAVQVHSRAEGQGSRGAEEQGSRGEQKRHGDTATRRHGDTATVPASPRPPVPAEPVPPSLCSTLLPYIEIVESSAKRGADLTRQLLAFARGGRYEVKPVNLNRIVKEVEQLLSHTIDKRIAIKTECHDSLATVAGDTGQLQQALLNICLNARDAMPKGGDMIIGTRNVYLDEDFTLMHLGARVGWHVLLSVTDTGVGMDVETQHRIFEPFFTTKGEGKGTGLGLAMVYGIVKNHEGFIRVYSEQGHGTTFQIYIPASHQPEASAPLSAVLQSPGGTEMVLVVDDEVTIRQFLGHVLKRAGYKVLLASSGMEALRLVEQHGDDIALVMLDMVMPEMDGKTTYDRMQTIRPDIKVLVSSGYSQANITRELLSRPGVEFLQKPYVIHDVLSAVRQLLDQVNG